MRKLALSNRARRRGLGVFSPAPPLTLAECGAPGERRVRELASMAGRRARTLAAQLCVCLGLRLWQTACVTLEDLSEWQACVSTPRTCLTLCVASQAPTLSGSVVRLWMLATCSLIRGPRRLVFGGLVGRAAAGSSRGFEIECRRGIFSICMIHPTPRRKADRSF